MSSEEFSQRDAITALQNFIVEVDGEPRIEVDVDGRRSTVEIRQIFEFERDILDRLIAPQVDNSVSGAAVPIKGEWIHGWLELKGEDYINNIWKNYQVFLKFIEARTSVIGNVATFQRAPGTYNSMYRYLIILEELGLLERFRTEEVPPEEYDFPVPAEFRERTFIRLTDEGIVFEDNKEIWDNPYEAEYPGGEKPDIDEDEEDGLTVEPTGDIPEELAGFQPEAQPEPTEAEPEEESEPSDEEGLGAFTGEPEEEEEELPEPEELSEEIQLPEENASFEDFPEKESIIRLVEQSFPEALRRTFEDAPIASPGAEPDDFSPGRIAVFGSWAVGTAVPGRTPLQLIVSVNDIGAPTSPGFVPAGIQQHLGDVMEQNNPYPDIFPEYSVTSAFNSAFQSLVNQVVRREQSELVYYSLEDMEFKELE